MSEEEWLADLKIDPTSDVGRLTLALAEMRRAREGVHFCAVPKLRNVSCWYRATPDGNLKWLVALTPERRGYLGLVDPEDPAKAEPSAILRLSRGETKPSSDFPKEVKDLPWPKRPRPAAAVLLNQARAWRPVSFQNRNGTIEIAVKRFAGDLVKEVLAAVDTMEATQEWTGGWTGLR